ncbi:hypothetical protein D0C16_07455 [Cellvibrio sp. KY-GH-1]|uniref:dicarboxylate/amino acid:cation symporter n=1 Tax=Cellvibrio sp. KY-GH-1 TaxID=2303332 RepID=UPI0012479E88|nr:dicarboxylate/amino acid:cation symporter [Cellvibrio sp. KY-GH-1]QEY15824.1 hypothetical protein D0C16_07455 [Cellvibrio sp. KY-GH-1]
MENITEYQYAWALYLAGALGCTLAAWLLFRRLGRVVTHFFVITVMVILFTPYAIDAEKMIMAPGVYTLVFGYFDGGFATIKPLLKVMLGIWALAQVLSLIYQMLTRGKRSKHQEDYHPYQQNSYEDEEDYNYNQRRADRNSGRGLSREERLARDELLHEEPIRAIR